MQLINDGTLPDAIFAANDLMAIGVMRAAREKGITIPEQLAVMGFDDIPAAGLVTPSLTTIAQYPEQLGQKAAALLLAQTDITAPLQGSTTEMPWGLVKRESA